MNSLTLSLRDAAPADFETIADIYSHYVINALATFEESLPSVDEMGARHASITDAGLPYVVAEVKGRWRVMRMRRHIGRDRCIGIRSRIRSMLPMVFMDAASGSRC